LTFWKADQKYLENLNCGAEKEDQLDRSCEKMRKYYIESRREGVFYMQ
jgi:hypothetical protein